MAWLEKATGLSFYPEDEKWIRDNRCDEMRKLYLGMDPWPEIPEDSEKVTVYVFMERGENSFSSCCVGNAVILNANKFCLYDSSCSINTLVHELAHSIQYRNSANLKIDGDKLAEGYGVYYEIKASKEMTGFPVNKEWEVFYKQFLGHIDKDNIEEICMADFSIKYPGLVMEEYNLGYALVTYMIDEYGQIPLSNS